LFVSDVGAFHGLLLLFFLLADKFVSLPVLLIQVVLASKSTVSERDEFLDVAGYLEKLLFDGFLHGILQGLLGGIFSPGEKDSIKLEVVFCRMLIHLLSSLL